jgi:flagellar hook-length control protein FliK
VPEISALPALPSTVVGGPTPLAGVAPAPAVAADPSVPSFLATLKNALAGLASVAMPQAAMTATVSVAAPADRRTQPDLPLDVDAGDDNPATDAMPEMLAVLGFLPVPSVLAPSTPPAPTGDNAASSAEARVAAPIFAAAPATMSAPTQAPVASAAAAPAQDGPARVDQTSVADLPKASTDAAVAVNTAPDVVPAEPLRADKAAAKTPAAATGVELPPEMLGAQRVQTPDDAAAPEAKPAQMTTHHQVATTVATPVNPQLGNGSSSHDGQSGDTDAQSRTPHLDNVAEPASPEPQIEAAAAAITTTAPIANAALPPHVRPAEVVNQIAHQADLYRLPGNKGVRIQLHPDDLGGVDVTLRYSAAGGIQLHINVEHASTGALVEAGWNQLRDALASQGITPDRLVMSVSAPASSSGADFSSNGQSSYRSDAGQMTFDQGRQGARDQNEPQRPSRAFFTDAESGSPVDSVRASATDARIDYRV